MGQTAKQDWSNLKPRVISGVIMLAIGLVTLWMGGLWWHLLVSVLCCAVLWELSTMLAPDRSVPAICLALLGGGAVLGALVSPGPVTLISLLLPAVAGAVLLGGAAVRFAGISLLILLAVYGLGSVRTNLGLVWTFWLVLVVVVTDVSGYFAGRTIGGPKFWPSLSPKKTWAGTIAGWIGSGVLGGLMMGQLPLGVWLILISMIVSFASQLGDISESAIKRGAGVKDSSNLIPGHGGVFDRFDGMLGAGLLLVFLGPMVSLDALGQ